MDLLILHILVVFAIMGILSAIRTPVWLWIPMVTAALAGAHYINLGLDREVGIIWILIGLFAYLFHIPWLRRKFITYPIFYNLKKMMSPMSRTEQEAIEAGETWKEAEIFQGKINWKSLWQFPKATMNDQEEAFLTQQTETLCKQLDNFQIEQDQDLPPAVWDYLKKERFFGMIIPEEYGGLGFSVLAHSNVIIKIATRSLAAAITVMVPNALGPAELLLTYGTEAQKKQFLPKLATGEDIPCFGLTSLQAGSDASCMQDRGIVCRGEYQGKTIIGIRLTWSKRYITLAPIATLLGLAFKLYDPDRLLEGDKDLGITLCLIPRTHPGVEIGARHNPMQHGFMNGPTQGKDVFIPVDWIIGGSKMAGQGWRMLMECLSAGRGISLPALSAAVGKFCYRTTGAYARLRRQFNLPIGRFQGVELVLARMAGYTYCLEAVRHCTLSALEQGKKPPIVTGIVKCYMTELSRQIINDAMDLHGGRALMVGARNYLYSIYRGVPISITVEGSNILMRNLVIFGQGIVRCHPYLQAEMRLLTGPESTEVLKKFDALFNQHFKTGLKNYIKLLIAGLTGSLSIFKPASGLVGDFARELTRMSYALAVTSDQALFILGGHLKRAERLSARLADVVSHIYIAMSVLKYYQDFGNDKKDLPHMKWVVQTSLYQIQEALFDFYQNFPNRFLAGLLRLSVFPFGRIYEPPSDALTPQMASLMMVPSAFRERLTQHCYASSDPKDQIGRLEYALEKVIKIWPILVKIEKGVKEGTVDKQADVLTKAKMALADHLIDETELEAVQIAEQAREEAMKVDEFIS